MTTIQLHGILAKEFGEIFTMQVGNPRNVLRALDCNRTGFIKRIGELHKEGLCYDIIINNKRIIHAEEMDNINDPLTIDLVPAISGSGFVAAIFTFLGGKTFAAMVARALIFAAISYALTPKPEVDQLEIEAQGSKQSLVFSNTVNVATQGAPVPLGYGRLKVGSQVIQATIKSYAQNQRPEDALTFNPFLKGLNNYGPVMHTNKI